jgi:hypothetical protein
MHAFVLFALPLVALAVPGISPGRPGSLQRRDDFVPYITDHDCASVPVPGSDGYLKLLMAVKAARGLAQTALDQWWKCVSPYH